VLRRVVLALAVLVAAWLVVCLVLFVWPPSESSAPQHASVVVVLSGDKRRLPPALELVRKGVAPVLAISSVDRAPRWREAQALCRRGTFARARVICFEAVPYSTRGEARTVARLARVQHWSSVVVVTSTFHVTRAKLLFRRCLRTPVYAVGAPSTWWRLPEEWLSETGKLLTQLTVERGC
jgi:uncharacterized SAM-binding protein YcdF (DUF218 family)